MHFDPFEEEFNLPATAVELRDGESGQDHVVGQEGKLLFGFGITVADPSKLIGILIRRFETCEPDDLVTDQPRGSVHIPGVDPAELQVLPGSDDEHRLKLIQIEGRRRGRGGQNRCTPGP